MADQGKSEIAEQSLGGLIPSHEVLGYYSALDPSLPALIIQQGREQRRYEFIYATVGQVIAFSALALFGGGFVYLVMQGHPKSAAGLLTAGVLNAISGFLRARLSDRQAKEPYKVSDLPKSGRKFR